MSRNTPLNKFWQTNRDLAALPPQLLHATSKSLRLASYPQSFYKNKKSPRICIFHLLYLTLKNSIASIRPRSRGRRTRPRKSPWTRSETEQLFMLSVANHICFKLGSESCLLNTRSSVYSCDLPKVGAAWSLYCNPFGCC
jgi:hypothetical protein